MLNQLVLTCHGQLCGTASSPLITLLPLLVIVIGQSGVMAGLPQDFSGGEVGDGVVPSVGAGVLESVPEELEVVVEAGSSVLVDTTSPLVLKFILGIN